MAAEFPNSKYIDALKDKIFAKAFDDLVPNVY